MSANSASGPGECHERGIVQKSRVAPWLPLFTLPVRFPASPNHRHASATTAGEQLRAPGFVGKGAAIVTARRSARQWARAMACRLRNRFQRTAHANWIDARERPRFGCRPVRVWYHQLNVLQEAQAGVLREVQFDAPGEAQGDLEV